MLLLVTRDGLINRRPTTDSMEDTSLKMLHFLKEGKRLKVELVTS